MTRDEAPIEIRKIAEMLDSDRPRTRGIMQRMAGTLRIVASYLEARESTEFKRALAQQHRIGDELEVLAKRIGIAAERLLLTTAASDDIIKALPVNNLSLPERVERNLRRAGVNTIAQLTQKSAKELLKIPGLGPRAVSEIGTALRRVDLFPARHGE